MDEQQEPTQARENATITLNDIADVLEEHGHVRGTYGCEGIGFCVLGAMEHLGASLLSNSHPSTVKELGTLACKAGYHPRGEGVRDKYWHSITDWSDATPTTDLCH